MATANPDAAALPSDRNPRLSDRIFRRKFPERIGRSRKEKKKRVVNMEKESKGRDVRETRDDEKRRFLTSADFPTPPDPRTTSLYSRIVGLEREKSDDRTPNSANSARGVPESSATA